MLILLKFLKKTPHIYYDPLINLQLIKETLVRKHCGNLEWEVMQECVYNTYKHEELFEDSDLQLIQIYNN